MAVTGTEPLEAPGFWRDVESSLPWVISFNKHMRRVELPRLPGSEIIIASDSSGQPRQTPYEVLGILIMDLDASLRWEARRQRLRRALVRDARRMAFKKLDEPVRGAHSFPF